MYINVAADIAKAMQASTTPKVFLELLTPAAKEDLLYTLAMNYREPARLEPPKVLMRFSIVNPVNLQKIAAIKAIRFATQAGLKAAKDFVESVKSDAPAFLFVAENRVDALIADLVPTGYTAVVWR